MTATRRTARRGRAQAPERWITDDHGRRDLYRRCTICRAWKLADTEHFYADHRRPGQLIGTCKPCKRAYHDEYKSFNLAHPETREQYLARAREARRRWIQRNPTQHRQIRNAAKRRRYEAHREQVRADARINYRLSLERQGRLSARRMPAKIGAYRSGNGGRTDIALDPLPLRLWLEAVIAAEVNDGQDLGAFCRSIGWQGRQLRGLREGTHRTVSLHTADRLLTGYGRPVVIRARDIERGLVEWAQEQPGNGTRLLRYIDRAEAVAHLADRSLMFLGDLWPELDA